MNNRNKFVILSVASAAILLSGGVLVQKTSAAENLQNGDTDLITRIANKFSLNKDEVKAVFDENHQEQQAKKEQLQADRLSQAVTDGKITAEQKTLIENKLAEIKQKMETIRQSGDNTVDHREQMRAVMDELKTWTSDNNIDTQWVRPLGRGNGGLGGEPGSRGDHCQGMGAGAIN